MLLLIIFVLFILARVIRNEVSIAKDIERESSKKKKKILIFISNKLAIPWKKIRNELFFSPAYRNIFSSFIGSGLQFLIMVKFHSIKKKDLYFKSCLVIVFGVLGFHYEHKGSMKTIIILLYSVSGFFNGYFTAKYYKYMGGKHWALNLITSSVLFPVNIKI